MTLKKSLLLLYIIATVVLVAVVAGGCGQKRAPGTEAGGKGQPIKVGVPLSYTGVYAYPAEEITKGMELYLESVQYKAGGRDIQLIKEDTQGKPDVALQKVRKLVESDNVDLLVGMVHSNEAYAVRDYVHNRRIPLIIANAGARDITREKGSPYIFRVSFANGQYDYPLGTYAYEKLGYRKVIVMAADYAAGHEKAEAFMEYFKRAGGQVVQEIYPPLGTNDYGPYLSQVKVKEADAVWAFFAGSDAVRFVPQFKEYGLKDKIPLIGAGDLTDEPILPSQGDAAVGIITSLHYSPALDTPTNQEFVSAFKSKYGTVPGQFAEQGYIAARVMVEALNAVNGETENKEKLLEAIKKVQFEAPQGPFKFHPESQNVVFNVYIRKVEKLPDGSLRNTVIDTIPGATDRW